MNVDEYATKWKQAAPRPSGVLGRARSLVRGASLSALSLANRSLGDRFLRCLFCHNVFDDQVQAFDRVLSALKQQGTFVDSDTCVDMVTDEREIDGRYYHLSFDDGFRNNRTNALPVLKQHGVPCIFFVPSSLVGVPWEAAKRYCMETTRYSGVIELLTWDDLEEMVSSGYEIGSHTRTHARFSAISHNAAMLEDEILNSKRELESRLGSACKYISWPYGRRADADALSLEAARSAGYRACFAAYRGTVDPGVTDILSVPRHHFEVAWPLGHIKYFARGNME